MMSQLELKVFTRLTRPVILPFYFFLLLFILLCLPHLQNTEETITTSVLKILPILYLAFYIHRQISRLQDITIEKEVKSDDSEENILSSLLHFRRGLLISSIGDICLVYSSCFKEGILAFGLAQFCYLLAFKGNYRRGLLAWSAIPLCIALNLALVPSIDDTLFKCLVLVYSVLIHSMLFFAIARYERMQSVATLCIMVGASLFVTSDFLIAYNKWVARTPYCEATILFTYYAAQLLLTVGLGDA